MNKPPAQHKGGAGSMGTWSKPGKRLTVTLFRKITESDEYKMGLWREESLCVRLSRHDPENYQPENWFPKNPRSIPPRIVAVCNECPVRLECLSYAIILLPIEGIWAGHTSKTITKMAKKTRRR